MSISAASFLYIALANLSPEHHHKVDVKYAITQFLLMITGVGTIILLLQLHPWLNKDESRPKTKEKSVLKDKFGTKKEQYRSSCES